MIDIPRPAGRRRCMMQPFKDRGRALVGNPHVDPYGYRLSDNDVEAVAYRPPKQVPRKTQSPGNKGQSQGFRGREPIAPARTRTWNLRFRRPPLYPVELRALGAARTGFTYIHKTRQKADDNLDDNRALRYHPQSGHPFLIGCRKETRHGKFSIAAPQEAHQA